MSRLPILFAALLSLSSAQAANVVVYTDFASWAAAAGAPLTIDFETPDASAGNVFINGDNMRVWVVHLYSVSRRRPAKIPASTINCRSAKQVWKWVRAAAINCYSQEFSVKAIMATAVCCA